MTTYVNDLPGFVEGHVSTAQGATNRQVIAQQTAAGVKLRVRAGTLFEIDQTLTFASSSGLIGDTDGPKPIVYLPAAAFTNMSQTSPAATNAVGLSARGQESGPLTPLTDVLFENLVIQAEPGNGRTLRGMFLRNIQQSELHGIETTGFGNGVGLSISSCTDIEVADYRAYSFYEGGTGWATTPQMTGLAVDDGRVAGTSSRNIRFADLWFKDLVFSPALVAEQGDQVDALNIAGAAISGYPATTNVQLNGMFAENVAEAIDNFGVDGLFTNIKVASARYSGLKCAHGASRNTYSLFDLVDCLLHAIVVTGSTAPNELNDLTSNVFHTGQIVRPGIGINIGSGTDSSGAPTALIRPRDTKVRGVTVTPGPQTTSAWTDTSYGSDNTGEINVVLPFPAASMVGVVAPGFGNYCRVNESPARHTSLGQAAVIPRRNQKVLSGVAGGLSYTPAPAEDDLECNTANGPITITLPPGWEGRISDRGAHAATTNITINKTPSCSFTATVAGNVMTVTAVASAGLYRDAIVAGSGLPSSTFVSKQLSGSLAGVGTYLLSANSATDLAMLVSASITTPTQIATLSEGAIFSAGSGTASVAISTNGGVVNLLSRGRSNGWDRS